jgi:hypothetical protein
MQNEKNQSDGNNTPKQRAFNFNNDAEQYEELFEESKANSQSKWKVNF